MKTSLLICMLLSGVRVFADPLIGLRDVVLVEQPANRADAFRVRHQEREFLVQLYFVHSPGPAGLETEALYYGVPSAEALRTARETAQAAALRQMRHPFVLHTRHTPVPGDREGRVYAFVTTSDGADLGAYLVRAGYARRHGPGWETPRGMDRAEMSAVLQDAEDAAKLERAGFWALSDPVRLPALRASLRRRERETPGAAPATIIQKVNINTADTATLLTLPGVDEVLAGRIERGRPYRNFRDLLDVRGIGVNLLSSWEGLISTE